MHEININYNPQFGYTVLIQRSVHVTPVNIKLNYNHEFTNTLCVQVVNRNCPEAGRGLSLMFVIQDV